MHLATEALYAAGLALAHALWSASDLEEGDGLVPREAEKIQAPWPDPTRHRPKDRAGQRFDRRSKVVNGGLASHTRVAALLPTWL